MLRSHQQRYQETETRIMKKLRVNWYLKEMSRARKRRKRLKTAKGQHFLLNNTPDLPDALIFDTFMTGGYSCTYLSLGESF